MAKSEFDRLEQFILDNRSEFDSEIPQRGDLKDIESVPNSRGFDSSILWKAAAVIFFGITIYMVADKYSAGDNEEIAGAQSTEFQEFQNLQEYYSGIIQVKIEEVENSLGMASPLIKDFKLDMAHLDSTYIELQKEFDCNRNEQIVSAMIQNMRMKMQILDRQLQIIQSINSKKNAENEGAQI